MVSWAVVYYPEKSCRSRNDDLQPKLKSEVFGYGWKLYDTPSVGCEISSRAGHHHECYVGPSAVDAVSPTDQSEGGGLAAWSRPWQRRKCPRSRASLLKLTMKRESMSSILLRIQFVRYQKSKVWWGIFGHLQYDLRSSSFLSNHLKMMSKCSQLILGLFNLNTNTYEEELFPSTHPTSVKPLVQRSLGIPLGGDAYILLIAVDQKHD